MTGLSPWPQQSVANMNAFYGNPDADHNGVPDRKWEDENIIRIPPPFPMVLAWDKARAVKTIAVHRKAADSLQRVFLEMLRHYKSAEALAEMGLHLYGGAYAFRLKRGGTSLSIHSWGAAIDLDPGHNQFGVKLFTMPKEVVEIFAAENWTWGGRWAKPDAMHFQAAHL